MNETTWFNEGETGFAETVGPGDFRRLMDRDLKEPRRLKRGQIVEGVVASVSRDEILVDIGCKSEGVVPAKEFQTLSQEDLLTLKPGTPILVQVLRPELAESSALLSIDRARGEQAWRQLESAFREGALVSARVVGCNRGGLLVDVSGLRGFIPHSHVLGLSADEGRRGEELKAMVGTVLEVKVLEISRSDNRLVLSQKLAEEELRRARKQRLIDQITVGEVRRGRVTGIRDFGVFVDIGGADGMVHVSELSWDRIDDPAGAFKIGDEVEVLVTGVDRENGRISLSIKRTKPEPWQEVAGLRVGEIVEVEVTQLTKFGAFARLRSGIEGLVHISELSDRHIDHPRQVVKPGDRVWVKILKVEPERRRVSLSLKQALEEGSGLVLESHPQDRSLSQAEGGFQPGVDAGGGNG